MRRSERRDFMKGAGWMTGALFGAVTGATATGSIPSSAAKGAAEMGHPSPEGPSKVGFDVRAFGAVGDGKALDTAAINRAIDEAAAVGGGSVYVPGGNYLCYSIRLKSKVSLYLGQGATIVAADPASDAAQSYDAAESNKPWESYQDYGHNHWHNSLIWGEGLNDVAICGPGLIWGKGLSRGWPSGRDVGPVAENPGVANKAIALKDCRNVLLRDF